jgi:hypothetical protein
LITPVVQRWRDRRDSYRPAREVVSTRSLEVSHLAESAARGFVVEHHYSGSYPAARRRFGLFERGELVGVAVYSVPCADRVITSCLPGAAIESVELGRFVLLDRVGANAETWMLARCFDFLRGEGFVGVVSYSDPLPRASADGAVVFGGHVGTIYQAHNARYLGQASRRTLRLLPDGSVFSARAAQKVRARERGWRYAAALLERWGAAALGEGDDAREWLSRWLPSLTRTVRHPGNHKYVWVLDRTARGLFQESRPYPKFSKPWARPGGGA